MNRAFSLATLALALTGGSAARAAEKPQPPAPPASAILQNAPKGTVVFDDDGGRAQIIPRRAVPAQEATYHGGPVVPRGAVQAVFLGGGWRKKENQGKESEVMRALRGPDGPDAEPLARFGVKAWESLNAPLEDTAGDPLSGTLISDLEIQARLDGMVSGGEPLDADAVFVVFLAPGLGSKLGSRTSEDFAAYHNHYHSRPASSATSSSPMTPTSPSGPPPPGGACVRR